MLKGLKNKKKLPKPMSVKEFDKLTLGGLAHSYKTEVLGRILSKKEAADLLFENNLKADSIEASIFIDGLDLFLNKYPEFKIHKRELLNFLNEAVLQQERKKINAKRVKA